MKQARIAVNVLLRVFNRVKEEILLCFLLYLAVNSAFAGLMLLAEDQHSAFKDFFSCFWWSCATITTVGYGDMVPTSFFGKIIAVLTMFSGILFFALPTSILGAAWVDELNKEGTI